MADINFTGNLSISKGNLRRQFATSRAFDFTSSAPPAACGIASIGTTHEAIAMGDVATAGWARFENLDATNYLEIGIVVAATFYPVVKLKATEFCIFPLGTNAPYAKSNTAACLLDYEIFER